MTTRPMSSSSSESGFTLIEVLVVVLMIAIIMAIAAPSWMAFLNQRRLAVVRDELSQKLEEAQSNAKQLRVSQTVTVYPNEPVPTISIGSAPQQGKLEPLGGGNIPVNNFVISANSTSITFDHKGQVKSFPPGSTSFVVKVSPAGSSAQRCVVIASLLGNVKSLNGADCDKTITP